MLPPPIDPAVLIRDVNATNEAVEDQCLRACQAADIAAQSAQVAELAETTARGATVAHRTIQAEHSHRRAPLPRQVFFALTTVALDGVACYFAAQTLDGSQDTTFIWTGLFLAVLAAGEVAMDFYRDRSLRTWRVVALLTGGFVALLGMLRFWFLATVGSSGLVPAVDGAFLFTVATAGFVALGYRALRAAETPQAWRARRAAHKAWQAARAARSAADRDERERNRLITAYLGHVRKLLLRTYPIDVQVALESAVRSHLSDRWALDEFAAFLPCGPPDSSGYCPRPGHLKLQIPIEPTAAGPDASPAGYAGFRSRHNRQLRFSVSDASDGGPRSGLGAPG